MASGYWVAGQDYFLHRSSARSSRDIGIYICSLFSSSEVIKDTILCLLRRLTICLFPIKDTIYVVVITVKVAFSPTFVGAVFTGIDQERRPHYTFATFLTDVFHFFFFFWLALTAFSLSMAAFLVLCVPGTFSIL